MATELGKPVEAVTTIIAKGMRQVVKLQPDMRARKCFYIACLIIDVRGAYLNADMKSPDGRNTYINV